MRQLFDLPLRQESNSRRRGRIQGPGRNRVSTNPMRFEPLEQRRLLSVTPAIVQTAIRGDHVYLYAEGNAEGDILRSEFETFAIQQYGGHLVSINDQSEDAWIAQTFDDKYAFWIGLNDIQNEGVFVWPTGEPVTYTNFSFVDAYDCVRAHNSIQAGIAQTWWWTLPCWLSDELGDGVVSAALIEIQPPETFVSAIDGNGRTISHDESTNSDSLTLSFGSDQPGSTYECDLGSGFVSCGASETYSGLTEGTYSVSVRARNPFGFVDPSPSVFRWIVDMTPPETTIDSATDRYGIDLPNNGASDSDFVTLVFSSNEPGSQFECSLDNGGFVGCVSGQSFGGLAVGAHSLEVRAIDSAGNTDPTPARFEWERSEPPDLTFLFLDWNDNRGPNWDPPQRGVDFGYEVATAELAIEPEVAFYWASGPNFSDKIRRTTTKTLNGTTVDTHQGTPNNPLNEPARWGTPPPLATHILMVLDPDGKIPESDEDNNVTALPIHSESEILSGAIDEPIVDGPIIRVKFEPGRGINQSLTLSEAEVVLGVDHFNWIQWVTDIPDTWQAATVYDFDVSRPREVDPSGFLRYTDGPSRIPQQQLRQTPFLDFIATNNKRDTRAFFIDYQRDGQTDNYLLWYIDPTTADVDPYFYYYSEQGNPRHALSYDPTLMAGALPNSHTFYDKPQQPDGVFFGASGTQPHIAFSTTLVGVNYSPSSGATNSHRTWTSYDLTVEWKSDYTDSQLGGVFGAGASLEEPSEETTSGGVFDANVTDTGIPVTAATVRDRHVFYNNSRFDDPTYGLDNDDAIDTNKSALLGDQTATFSNYTNYAKGLNGIMVDIENLMIPEGISATDFEFRVGDDSETRQWNQAPLPTTVAARALPGTNIHRVTIIWQDADAVKNQWLQVKILPSENTGLTVPDVFYFGNLIGDTGDSPIAAVTDLTDLQLAFAHVFSAATIDSAFDVNRNGIVDFTDVQLMYTNFFQRIRMIVPSEDTTPFSDALATVDSLVTDNKNETGAVDRFFYEELGNSDPLRAPMLHVKRLGALHTFPSKHERKRSEQRREFSSLM